MNTLKKQKQRLRIKNSPSCSQNVLTQTMKQVFGLTNSFIQCVCVCACTCTRQGQINSPLKGSARVECVGGGRSVGDGVLREARVVGDLG